MPGWPSENQGNGPVCAAPPVARPIRARLDTVGDVKAQLGRIYREARGGTISTQDATRLASILGLLSRIIEGSDLEARIAALEGQA